MTHMRGGEVVWDEWNRHGFLGYNDLRTEYDRLKVNNARLLEALVKCTVPYEALLADSESRKWIAPTIWRDIEDGVRAARAELVRLAPQSRPEGR
mgnify:CR=1 FL=1